MKLEIYLKKENLKKRLKLAELNTKLKSKERKRNIKKKTLKMGIGLMIHLFKWREDFKDFWLNSLTIKCSSFVCPPLLSITTTTLFLVVEI